MKKIKSLDEVKLNDAVLAKMDDRVSVICFVSGWHFDQINHTTVVHLNKLPVLSIYCTETSAMSCRCRFWRNFNKLHLIETEEELTLATLGMTPNYD